jgi:phenylacetate-coenzyme A ligase PaaK-like adenylate-forming protein
LAALSAQDSVEVLVRARDEFRKRLNSLRGGSNLTPFFEHVIRTVPRYSTQPCESWANLSVACFPEITRFDIARDSALFLSNAVSDRFSHKTSGTSGEPLTAFYDLAAWYEDNNYPYVCAKAVLVGKLAGTKAILFTDKPGLVAYLSFLPELDCIPFELMTLENLVAHRTDLSSVVLIHGRASAMVRNLDLLLACGLKPSLVICSGERLYGDLRQLLVRRFCCPLLDIYASAEGGVIATECLGGAFHVSDLRIVEIRQDDGSLVPEGEGELVITNPFNWCMGFIRYRTGDFGEIKNICCPCGRSGPCLMKFLGRDSSQLSAADRTFPAFRLERVMMRLGVRDYCFHTSDGPLSLTYTKAGCLSSSNLTKAFKKLAGRKWRHLFTIRETVPDHWLGRKAVRFGGTDQTAAFAIRAETPISKPTPGTRIGK